MSEENSFQKDLEKTQEILANNGELLRYFQDSMKCECIRDLSDELNDRELSKKINELIDNKFMGEEE